MRLSSHAPLFQHVQHAQIEFKLYYVSKKKEPCLTVLESLLGGGPFTMLRSRGISHMHLLGGYAPSANHSYIRLRVTTESEVIIMGPRQEFISTLGPQCYILRYQGSRNICL